MATNLNTKGLAELQRYLNQLPAKLEANIMRGALRAGAKPIAEAARQNAPTGEPSEAGKRRYKLYNGALRDSIRISGRIDRRNGNIKARVIAGGKSRKTRANVFYAHMVEYGTRRHSTKRRGRGDLNHPGTTPKPFLRPALDSASGEAIKTVGEYVKRRLATKHGIDTADINIGLDEE
jgi:HK97 gp10 family phage protein